jgi:hypothetical protein
MLRSPVGILSLHDAQVSAQTSAQVVVALFQQCAYVPGIVITSESTEPLAVDTVDVETSSKLTFPSPPMILGVLSRQLFFERGCLSSGDRGWDQPIENFLLVDQDPALVVSDRTPILEVALSIRHRPRIFSLEPIVVTFRDGSIRLIDSRDVLFAQAQILLEEQAQADAKNQEIRDYQLQLESQTRVLDDLNQMVNVRNITLQNQQRHLERQQHDLFQRTEAAQQLRQRLMDIRVVLDSKVRTLFQGRLELVATIAASTDQLMRTDISLAKELEVVIALSETIQQVSRQARFLKLHSAIFINRPQTNSLNGSNGLTGFSQVTEGIERLMTQTADADQRVGDSVGQIKLNITELARAAQDIAQATEALIQQMKATDELLSELEALADTQAPHESLLTPEQNQGLRIVRSKMRTIENVSQELGQLYQSDKPYNLRTMLQTLESRLRRR